MLSSAELVTARDMVDYVEYSPEESQLLCIHARGHANGFRYCFWCLFVTKVVRINMNLHGQWHM